MAIREPWSNRFHTDHTIHIIQFWLICFICLTLLYCNIRSHTLDPCTDLHIRIYVSVVWAMFPKLCFLIKGCAINVCGFLLVCAMFYVQVRLREVLLGLCELLVNPFTNPNNPYNSLQMWTSWNQARVRSPIFEIRYLGKEQQRNRPGYIYSRIVMIHRRCLCMSYFRFIFRSKVIRDIFIYTAQFIEFYGYSILPYFIVFVWVRVFRGLC